MNTDHFMERLRQPCPVPVGTRIELLAMPEDPDPIEVGAQGTVTGGNAAQVYVEWDNGRSLILCPDVDRFRVIP